MLTNKQIAESFNLLAQLMELHGEPDYRIRTYTNAYRTLRTTTQPLAEMSLPQLKELKGIGDTIGNRILEIQRTGTMTLLEQYRQRTPAGLLELLHVKGLGVKKLVRLWAELQIETPGELLYACQENRLVLLNGFGPKTQAELQQQVQYLIEARGWYRYATLENHALDLLDDLTEALYPAPVSFTGPWRRQMPTVQAIEILTTANPQPAIQQGIINTLQPTEKPNCWRTTTSQGHPVLLHTCPPDQYQRQLLLTTGPDHWVQPLIPALHTAPTDATEVQLLQHCGVAPLPAYLRDLPAPPTTIPQVVQDSDLKGIIHAHSTYSDGAHTLEQMARYCIELGYQYLVITDHSQSAVYANGLKPERLHQQWAEIEHLNTLLAPFRIFRGIESDILSEGQLDYPDSILQQFEVVIASVHSGLRMEPERATQRLLRAIEHPATTILGHPTGRLLLSRQGYPIHHERIIEACAQHHVAIELNASPYRLDLDWSWIPYAVSCGVPISINPDAHSTSGIHDLHYGVLAAQKGGLTTANTLSALSLEQFQTYLNQHK